MGWAEYPMGLAVFAVALALGQAGCAKLVKEGRDGGRAAISATSAQPYSKTPTAARRIVLPGTQLLGHDLAGSALRTPPSRASSDLVLFYGTSDATTPRDYAAGAAWQLPGGRKGRVYGQIRYQGQVAARGSGQVVSGIGGQWRVGSINRKFRIGGEAVAIGMFDEGKLASGGFLEVGASAVTDIAYTVRPETFSETFPMLGVPATSAKRATSLRAEYQNAAGVNIALQTAGILPYGHLRTEPGVHMLRVSVPGMIHRQRMEDNEPWFPLPDWLSRWRGELTLHQGGWQPGARHRQTTGYTIAAGREFQHGTLRTQLRPRFSLQHCHSLSQACERSISLTIGLQHPRHSLDLHVGVTDREGRSEDVTDGDALSAGAVYRMKLG